MTDDFCVVLELLERQTTEVGGRAAAIISREVRQKLAKMAAGLCDGKQREELIRFLAARPDLVAVLAQEIQKLRKLPR